MLKKLVRTNQIKFYKLIYKFILFLQVFINFKDHKWIDKRTDGEIYFKSPNIEIKNNNDGTVNVYGDIYLDDLNINIVPWIKKYIVNELFGNLDINNNNFTSLKNFPKIIHGDLNICDNLLENDDGDLQLIDGDANFSGNNIKISKIKIKGQLIK